MEVESQIKNESGVVFHVDFEYEVRTGHNITVISETRDFV